MKWKSDDDLANIIFANESAKICDVVAAICASQCAGWLRCKRQFIGERESDAFLPVIERENAAGFGDRNFRGGARRGCGHRADLIISREEARFAWYVSFESEAILYRRTGGEAAALSRAGAGNSIGDLHNLYDFRDVVNAYNVRAAENRSGDSGCSAPRAMRSIGRKAARFICPANERFARWPHEKWKSERRKFLEIGKRAQNFGESFFRSRCRGRARSARAQFRRDERA